MKKRAILLCALLVGSSAGCGGDDEDPAPGDAGDQTQSGGSGSENSGGSGGTQSGTGGSQSSTGGTSATPPLMCADTECPLPPGQELLDMLQAFGLPPFMLFEPCCTSDDACGLFVADLDDAGASAGSVCVAPPASDPRCPDQALLGEELPGCCVEETGMCGLDGAQLGLPCTDYAEDPIIGGFLGLEQIACDGFDAGVDASVGDEDAGD